MSYYFESHAHYDDKRYDGDREELLSAILPAAGVSHIVNAGADMVSSRTGIALAERYGYFYAAVGVHPHEAKSLTDSDLAELAALTAHEKVVAVGEIGLDYYYDYSPRDIQVKMFLRQLDIAKEANLPVIIHSRDACRETFDILSEWSGSLSASNDRKGVVHCFSSSAEVALEYVKMGFYIGLGGVVTYKNAKKAVEVAECVPLERLLIETDCPYLSPVPNRGKRNDSQNLSFIAEKIAQIRQISREKVASVTKENSLYLFSMK